MLFRSRDTVRTASLELFARIKAQLDFLGKHLPPDGTLLDIGSGEGTLALEAAKSLRAKSIILTDVEDDVSRPLPNDVVFDQIDVCSPVFAQKYRCKPTVITCFQAFHEFENPGLAATNLMNVIPMGGKILIMDYAEQGWQTLEPIARQHGADSLQHYLADRKRLTTTKLDSNAGIRSFWEETLSPRVPGRCTLAISGNYYFFLYEPAEWGVYKPYPHHLG